MVDRLLDYPEIDVTPQEDLKKMGRSLIMQAGQPPCGASYGRVILTPTEHALFEGHIEWLDADKNVLGIQDLSEPVYMAP